MTQDVKLPPLPRPSGPVFHSLGGGAMVPDQDLPRFNNRDLQAYARLAVLQERERCARLATRIAEEDDAGSGNYELGYRAGARCVAAAIMNPNHPYDAIRAGHSVTETKRD